MHLINKLLRVLLTLVVLYFLTGAILAAYYEIVIYPDSLAGIFEPVAKHIVLIHNNACDFLERLFNAFSRKVNSI